MMNKSKPFKLCLLGLWVTLMLFAGYFFAGYLWVEHDFRIFPQDVTKLHVSPSISPIPESLEKCLFFGCGGGSGLHNIACDYLSNPEMNWQEEICLEKECVKVGWVYD